MTAAVPAIAMLAAFALALGGVTLLRRSDAVVLCPGWEASSGTLAEIAEAERLLIPVYISADELPEAPAV